MIKKYLYKQIANQLSLHIQPNDTILEINPKNSLLAQSLNCNYQDIQIEGNLEALHNTLQDVSKEIDYVVLNGTLHYAEDIQKFLSLLQSHFSSNTRIILTYYSNLWRPLIQLSTLLGLRKSTPEGNWLTFSDIINFASITKLEVVNHYSKISLPFFIPVISFIFNKFLPNLPVFQWFSLVNFTLLRPIKSINKAKKLSVSVVVAARNESGNIEEIIQRLPKMGPSDELIFVEGNSTDDTWNQIQKMSEKYKSKLQIKIAQQDGKGKGDVVRKGFQLAEKEILMILDADMTVPPEDLPKFYHVIKGDIGEFVNGSRLVYPMEKEAMRFFNLMGNKFFALAFSYVLNQPIKDTLCGTKVLSKENYKKLANSRSYFGDFDPFGDFDLLFGASRMGLKIVEVPIKYRARVYGDTNIQRWKHGWILLKMLVFASHKLKFK